MVYQPTVVKGNKPVTIGHQYSTVALLSEKKQSQSDSWLTPLMTQRVTTAADEGLTGAGQIDALLSDEKLPFATRCASRWQTVATANQKYLVANHQQQPRNHRPSP